MTDDESDPNLVFKSNRVDYPVQYNDLYFNLFKRKREADLASVNNSKPNLWDNREPSLERWWEMVEKQHDEIPNTITTSPLAKQVTKQWLEKRMIKNSNYTGEHKKLLSRKSTKKDDLADLKVIPTVSSPCPDMVPLSVVRFSVNSLITAVRRLYDQWSSGPYVMNAEVRGQLSALISRLRWLVRDLDGTSGTCDQLALLVDSYDACRAEYKQLAHRFDSGPFGRVDEKTKSRNNATQNEVRRFMKAYGCKCRSQSKDVKKQKQ